MAVSAVSGGCGLRRAGTPILRLILRLNGAELSGRGMGVSPVEDCKPFDHGRDAHATMVKAMPKPLKSAPFHPTTVPAKSLRNGPWTCAQSSCPWDVARVVRKTMTCDSRPSQPED